MGKDINHKRQNIINVKAKENDIFLAFTVFPSPHFLGTKKKKMLKIDLF